MNKSYNIKNKFLKNIALGSFLFGSFTGTFSQLQADPNKKDSQRKLSRSSSVPSEKDSQRKFLSSSVPRGKDSQRKPLSSSMPRGKDSQRKLSRSSSVLPAHTTVEKSFAQPQSHSLHDVVLSDDAAEVLRLLQAGADPNELDRFGYTPLQCATSTGMIDLLCALGADINKPNQWGDTPLRGAVSVPNPNLQSLEHIKQLLRKGAQKDIQDAQGKTPVEAVQEAIEWGIVHNGRFNSHIDDDARKVYAEVLKLFFLPQHLW
ncbi:MAG: ankyrin repeat domain-containing protein [Puniceicoccales bacterium]|jgi:hypothetical protein|nr:ankyrin repeat domain-containing protein [Puniceicoccales bacterium]